jgi:FHA domain
MNVVIQNSCNHCDIRFPTQSHRFPFDHCRAKDILRSLGYSEMSLILYNTNFKQLDGNGPEAIDLRRATTVIGRGSQTFPVDAAIFARRSGADIISRRHVEITRSAADVFTITDLNAVNGTFVNSIRLLASQELNSGDIIQFGGLTSAMTGPDGFCVKYIFSRIGNSSTFQNAKVGISKKEELNRKKNAKKGAKSSKKCINEAVDLSNCDSEIRSRKRVRIDVTNESRKSNHNGNIINIDNINENQNVEGNLRNELDALRNEMKELKMYHLAATMSANKSETVSASTSASISAQTEGKAEGKAETEAETLHEISQKQKNKNIPSSSGSARKNMEKNTEKNEKSNTPKNKGRGSREDLVQHSTAIKASKDKEISTMKEDSDRNENSSSRGIESSSRTECSLITQTSNSTLKCKSSSSGCAIDISSLRSILTCAICSLVLLDAVVVPCSHGVSSVSTVCEYSV